MPRKTKKGKADFAWLRQVKQQQEFAEKGGRDRAFTDVGTLGRKKTHSEPTLADKFNYAAMDFNAKRMFEKYDRDQSGTIDADELTSLLYDLGIRMTPATIQQAMGDLQMDFGEVEWPIFSAWWDSGYGKDKKVRESLLKQLSKDMREQYIPHIKSQFQKADKSGDGSLSKTEFRRFYPDLAEFLGYSLPQVDLCMQQMDNASSDDFGFGFEGGDGDGQISYTEFEAWFLTLESSRASHAANAVSEIQLQGKVDMSALMSAFGQTKKIQKKVQSSRKDKAKGGIARMFSYNEPTFDARDLFDRFDADKSNTIDAMELEDILYELGVRLTPENIQKAKDGLKIGSVYEEVDFKTFETWVNTAPIVQSCAARKIQLEGLAAKYKDQIVPYIKKIFAEGDTDQTGALDFEEFQTFYPKLKKYLGYPIPSCVACMNQIDSSNSLGSWDDGLIEYGEFEAWFLGMEKDRATAKA